MKKQLKRFSKSTLSIVLTLCMLFSCVMVATNAAVVADSGAVAATSDSESVGSNTSDGTARLFFNMNALNWWIADSGNQNFAYFYNNTTNKNAWSAHSVQQTGNYYYVVVPSGTWEGVILTRNDTTDAPSWDNKWNQTGNLTWTAGKNYISAFDENSTTATFDTYQVTSTASLSASSTSVSTGENVTLTPSLSSNTDYNVLKSTTYSVTTNPGSAGSVTSAGVFSATAAGTYTVTATVTYNAKGFTNITKTATATKTITVTTDYTQPVYSLVGNITSDFLEDSALSESDFGTDNTKRWATYYSDYAVNNPTGTSGVFSITITTKADIGSHNSINIGLYDSTHGQLGFYDPEKRYDNRDWYTQAGQDFTVPEGGAENLYIATKLNDTSGGGTLVLQPGMTYTITIDQTQGWVNQPKGKISITTNSAPKIIFGVGSGSGTVTATNTTTSTTLTSGDEITKGDTVKFTAAPGADNEFVGWYSNSTCTTQLSTENPYTVSNVQSTKVVYAKFKSTLWPPEIITDDFKEPSSSDTNQFYVSKSNGLDYTDSSNTHYYYGGNTNSDYKMLQNGGKYWIVLSSTDLALVQQNEFMYFAFSTKKDRSGLSTNSSTSVNSDATMNYSITETAKQEYRFGNDTTYYYARVKTSTDRSDIEYAGVLYDKDNNTYTIYYSSPGARNKVNVYAKNGTVRSADNGADSMVSAYLGTTTVEYTASDNISQTELTTKYWSAYNSDHSKANNAEKVEGNAGQKVVIKDKDAGATLKIKTTVKDDYKDKWYVKGFSVNGGTTEAVVDGWSADKNYNEFTLHIDSESDGVIEITPIYFPKETTSSVTNGGQTYDVTNTVRFYVTGYDKSVQDAWGNTVAAYSYIDGGYTPLFWPGQPMVNEGGRFYVDVERNNDSSKSQGMALSNYSWDDIHYDIFLKGTTTREWQGKTVTVGSQQQGNKQTYDFNDFSVLANTDAVRLDDEDIIFSFKYTPGVDEAATDNFGGMNRDKIAASYTSSQMNVDPDTKDIFNNKEYLTDFYGNKVDLFGNKLSETDLQKTPLRVVSQGYDDTIDDSSGTNIGHYGTAWAIYQKQSDDSFNLVELYSSQSKLIAMEKTDTFYTTYKNTPVLISYEYSIYHNKGNASGCTTEQPAERCDGRWYVSSSTETLKGHTIIQYTDTTTGNQPDASYAHDWFNDQTNIDYTSATGYDPSKNKGQTTLATASFTNTEVRFNNTRGYTEATLNSSGDYSFNYEVTEDPTSVYTFEGWYLYSEGKYTFITKQRSWSSVANSNDVFVARFYKTPDGSVTISHSLVSSAGNMGFADCNVQINVINGEGTTIFSSPTTVGGYKITPDKIKAGYKLAVTLTTDVKDGSYWDNFYATNAREILLSSYTPSPDYLQDNTGFIIANDNPTATFTVDIDKLFGSVIEGTKSLAYYSSVKSEYYTITYQYRSRLWSKQSNDSTFNLQTYTVTGKFDPDTFEKYAEYRTNENGKYVMLNSAGREEFLAIHAPYEDNFQRTITWNFGDGSADSNTGHDLRITVGYTESDVPTLNFTYKVPYSSEYQSVTGGIVATNLHEGIPIKNTDTTYYKTADSKYLTVGFMKRYTVSQLDESSFLQAAPEIWNATTNQKEYFQYWAMRDFDGNEIRKCYSNQFNMAFYESYMIEAIYDTSKTTPADVAENTGITAQIDFLENSRNQWNNNGGGDLKELMKNDNSKKYWYRFGDRIFSDFVLTYNYNNKLINSLGNSGVEAGVLIEQVQKLDTDSKGFYITDIEHYKPEYSTTNAENYLSNQSYTGKFIKDVVTTQLDNKNSLEYYYQFANIKQAKNETDPDKVPTTNKEYLYRAYTYIKDGTNTVISNPVYFTIYDIASIANYSESDNYSSN